MRIIKIALLRFCKAVFNFSSAKGDLVPTVTYEHYLLLLRLGCYFDEGLAAL